MRFVVIAVSIAFVVWIMLQERWRTRVQNVINTAEKIAYEDATRRGW